MAQVVLPRARPLWSSSKSPDKGSRAPGFSWSWMKGQPPAEGLLAGTAWPFSLGVSRGRRGRVRLRPLQAPRCWLSQREPRPLPLPGDQCGFWNHPPSWEHERRWPPGLQVLFPRRSEERHGLPRPRSRGITVEASRESEAQAGGSACAGASSKHSSPRRAGPRSGGAGATRSLPRSLIRAAREAVCTAGCAVRLRDCWPR